MVVGQSGQTIQNVQRHVGLKAINNVQDHVQIQSQCTKVSLAMDLLQKKSHVQTKIVQVSGDVPILIVISSSILINLFLERERRRTKLNWSNDRPQSKVLQMRFNPFDTKCRRHGTHRNYQ